MNTKNLILTFGIHTYLPGFLVCLGHY